MCTDCNDIWQPIFFYKGWEEFFLLTVLFRLENGCQFPWIFIMKKWFGYYETLSGYSIKWIKCSQMKKFGFHGHIFCVSTITKVTIYRKPGAWYNNIDYVILKSRNNKETLQSKMCIPFSVRALASTINNAKTLKNATFSFQMA